jgi:hypothetical protein
MKNKGHDIVRAFSEGWNAIYVDGKLVYDYDYLPISRVMEVVLEQADGNVSSYEEKEVSYNWFSSRDMTGGGYFPESIEDVRFIEDEPEVIHFETADSANSFSNVVNEIKKHDEVEIRYSCDEPTKKVLKGYMKGSGIDLSNVTFTEASRN